MNVLQSGKINYYNFFFGMYSLFQISDLKLLNALV